MGFRMVNGERVNLFVYEYWKMKIGYASKIACLKQELYLNVSLI